MKQYTLLLCPTEEGKEIYKNFPEIFNNLNAGVDLFAVEDYQYDSSKPLVHLLDLGVRAVMYDVQNGEQVHFTLEPRSSIFKSGYMMANSRGIIDRSYRGTLKAPIIPQVPGAPQKIEARQRLFQILAPDLGWIHRVQVVDSLDETSRGEGGFGSTGR
jgi:deoxyuridine 5'-triphosphate nucleotidohydrolase